MPINVIGFLGSSKYPLLYFNMPKSACTSIKNIINIIDGGEIVADPRTIHDRLDLLVRGKTAPDVVRARLSTDFTFTFVRHPLRRAYSCYNEKFFWISPFSFPSARQLLVERYGGAFPAPMTLDQQRSNFLAFLRLVADSAAGDDAVRRDPHWLPQFGRVKALNKGRLLDFIGRVETFKEDLAFVLGKAGYEGQMAFAKMNEGPPPPFGYDEILTDEIVEMGKSVYRDDYRAFGYTS